MPTLTLRDGASLAYDDYNFVEPWLTPEPIVLIHGFSKNRLFWYSWLPALGRRFRVIRLDLRGHGESSVPSPDFQMALEPFAADVNDFMERLELDSAHFVFAEFATMVGLEFAASYPERLRTLTLVGMSNPLQALEPTRIGRINSLDWATLIEREGMEAWARATNDRRLPVDSDPALKEWYVTQQARMPSWLVAGVMRFVPTVDLREKLPKIQTPTLILAGGAAEQTTVDQVQRAAELMPNAEVVVLEGAPFNVMTNRTEECLAATTAFVERHAK